MTNVEDEEASIGYVQRCAPIQHEKTCCANKAEKEELRWWVFYLGKPVEKRTSQIKMRLCSHMHGVTSMLCGCRTARLPSDRNAVTM